MNTEDLKKKFKRFYDNNEELVVLGCIVVSTAVLTTGMNAIVTKRILNGTRIQIDWNLFGEGAGRDGYLQ